MMDIKSPVAEARNEYTYSASGQKLKVVQRWNPNFSTAPVIGSGINTTSLTQTRTTDYTGNIIYENNALKRILVDGGYYEGGVYYYYLADHLGNNHVVVKSDGTSIQSLSYYPFGMHFAPGIGYEKQPYKYNNKELDQMHGLNMYDNLARLYDPVIPHTPTPDPHAENYYSLSPYSWTANNPLKVIDPTGMDTMYVNPQGEPIITIPGGEDIIFPVARDIYVIPREVGKEPIDAFLLPGLPRRIPPQGGRIDGVYPEFAILVPARAGITLSAELLISTMVTIRNMMRGPGTTNTIDASRSGFVQFGKDSNQKYHTFRHVDDLGLNKDAVEVAVRSDLLSASSRIVAGQPYNGVITVCGVRLQYTAYKLSDGTINIGRIHGI
ncbi:RHS repeat domain-containing protein [Dysgonomonas termitidis]|uniref:RHS repeat domain-containing protein n=1 Tax=Dysgonomonas termitidis TaxID=1516126 RepID=A0ABV9KV41_9BACT